MADVKITALTENTTPLSTDIIPMVDDPGSTPLTQKVTLGNFFKAIPDTGGTTRITLATSSPHILLTGQARIDASTTTGIVLDITASGTHSANFTAINITPTMTMAATWVGITITPTVTFSGNNRTLLGISGNAVAQGASAGTGYALKGLSFAASPQALSVSTTFASSYGVEAMVTGAAVGAGNTLTVTNAYGIYSQIKMTSVASGVIAVTTAYAYFAASPAVPASSITNYYGMKVEGYGSATNAYGIAIGDMSGGTLAYGLTIDAFDASASGTQYPFHYGDVGTPLTYMDRLGGLTVSSSRNREVMTPTDVDTQNHTLTVAQIVGGIVVHTSVTGLGTITTDTAANIIAGSSGKGVLAADGESIICWYINDGTQVLTFVGGSNVTIADSGQTIGNQESALLLFRRASSTTVTMYHIGA